VTLSPDTLKAVRKHGKSVDALARKRYGISGAALLAKTVKGESGDNPDAVSSAGAKGRAQFMPSSRDIARKKYGVDPYSGKADDEVRAMALHLRGKINGSKGLEGYNPGDPNYPKYILGQKVGDVHGGKRTQQPGSAPARRSPSSKSTTTTRTKQDVEGALLDALIERRGKKGSLLKSASVKLDSGAYDTKVKETKTTKSTETPKGDVEEFDAPAPTNGKVKFAPGADREGVPTKDVVKGFLGNMTKYAGTISVGTGTRHNKMSSSGNVSDHWTGNGADIPATGSRGDKIAYAAFRAAGVDEKTARRYASNGGLYNLTHKGHRVQIIWKTNTGGNHFDHVHVGIK